jgi:hypothetical protein
VLEIKKCSGGGSGTILDYPLVDVTYGYSNVGLKSPVQGEATIMAARGGSNPSLSTKKICGVNYFAVYL